MGQWEEKLGAILNDPQAMGQIMSLAQSLGGQGAAQAAPQAEETPGESAGDAGAAPGEGWAQVSAQPDAPELDPRLMAAGMRALSVWNDPDDPRAALLQALWPFLKEERRGKLDKAIRVTRLSKAVRAALEGLRGGGQGDV